MDALVQLAATRRRPPPVDLALAGGLLVWALLEAAFVEGRVQIVVLAYESGLVQPGAA